MVSIGVAIRKKHPEEMFYRRKVRAYTLYSIVLK